MALSPSQAAHARPTPYFWFMVVWVVLSTFQYGFGISELNAPQSVMSCKQSPSPAPSGRLPPCVPMTDAEFGTVTAVFSIGGLLFSLLSPHFSVRLGRKRCLVLSSLLYVLGSASIALAAAQAPLVLGRFVTGLGAGLALCTVPPFIAELSPPEMRGAVGISNQLSVVVGIFAAQSLGLAFRRPSSWRWIPTFALVLAVVQLALSPFAVESPGWLVGEGANTKGGGEVERARRRRRADVIRQRLWELKRDEEPEADALESEALLAQADVENVDAENANIRRPNASSAGAGVGPGARDPIDIDRQNDNDGDDDRPDQLGWLGLFKSRQARPGLLVIAATQFTQQASGINAVLYYSTDIMASVVPDLAGVIGLLITVVNFVFTFPPIFLVERVGRKPLLQMSALGMAVSAFFLGWGIDWEVKSVSAVAVLVFVAAFSIGLGPVTWVIVPEVVPSHAVSAATSFGLTLNWLTNFLVGSTFLPLRAALRHLDGKGGAVFWVFAAVSTVMTVVISRVYRT